MTKRLMVLAVLACLVLIVGWYEGFYRSEESHISSLKTTEQSAQTKVLAMQTRYAGLLTSEKQLPAERAALAALRRSVPDGPELDKLVTMISAAASEAGVQLSNIGSPQPSTFGAAPAVAPTTTTVPASTSPADAAAAAAAPAVPTGPAQLTLSLNVAGTATQIENLVRILESEPRLFVIDNFSLTFGTSGATGASRGGGSHTLTGTTLTVRAFYAVPTASDAAS